MSTPVSLRAAYFSFDEFQQNLDRHETNPLVVYLMDDNTRDVNSEEKVAKLIENKEFCLVGLTQEYVDGKPVSRVSQVVFPEGMSGNLNQEKISPLIAFKTPRNTLQLVSAVPTDDTTRAYKPELVAFQDDQYNTKCLLGFIPRNFSYDKTAQSLESRVQAPPAATAPKQKGFFAKLFGGKS